MVFRLAALVLIAELAWFALNPSLDPNTSLLLRTIHLGSYFLLGALCTAAFPRRVWVGIGVALIAAIGIEFLQVLVPIRNLRAMDLTVKWLSVSAGVAFALAVMYVLEKYVSPKR